MELVEHIKSVAVEAGRKILKIYETSDFGIESKADNSPLTKADRAANDYIVEQLQKVYPEFGILTEESKFTNDRLKKEYVWVIDPLDGTKEFIKRNGEFTVNIGLVKSGEPILGVVYIPVRHELYYAAKGTGCYFQNSSDDSIKIKCSAENKYENMTLVKSRSHASDKLQELIEKYKFINVIESGSSIKICLIAHGKADVYFRFGLTNEWDICAAHCVLNEAGGQLTDCYGDKITYNREDPLNKTGFLSSNGVMHEDLVKIAEHYFKR